MYKNFLFDVDGTILPMDMEGFIKLYLGSLCRRCVPVTGVDSDTLIKGIWGGAESMAKNDGSALNSEVFWQAMNKICDKDMREYEGEFDDYYRNEFIAARQATSVNPYAAKSVDLIKSAGGRLVAATNPIFPASSTLRRIEWGGVSPDSFEYITVYDNSTSCKPNLNYYREICGKLKIKPEESIMIGNDVDEDLCAAELGFDTFLITDCLINRKGKDFSAHKHGSFEEFYDFLSNSL